jgi:5-methylcytosine-specific restriction enzyme A
MAITSKVATGKMLNELWGVGAVHALYREDGKWYHRLERFPGALFDSNGYVLFRTQEEYLRSPYLQRTQDLHVDRGISSIPGYVHISASGSLAEFSAQVLTIARNNSSTQELSAALAGLNPTAEAIMAIDIQADDEVARALTQIYRILRNTKVARWVKFVHEYRCQICDTTIQLPDRLYAEAHHVKPLGAGHKGLDVIENVMCLCPNHHAELGYGAIHLDESKIHKVRGHYVSAEFIEFHNQFIYLHNRRRSG